MVHFLIILFLTVLWWYTTCRPVQTVSGSEILRRAKTGDVVLFRSVSRPWYYVAIAPMTHVGVVIVRAGVPYILEMHQYKDAPPGYPDVDGPRLYPLSVRIQEATQGKGRWTLFYAALQRRLPVNRDVSWAFPPAYIPYDYEYLRKELVCHMGGLRSRVPSVPVKMHCGNYAAWVLRTLGISDPETRIDCLGPLDVLTNGTATGTFAPLVRIS